MTKLLVSALALTLSTAGAWAESHTGSDTDGSMSESGMGASTSMDDADGLIRTRDITGGNVYTMNEADDEGWSPDTMYDAVGADWNDIGEIEDIVLNRTGQMIGIVAEVGGFLDVADKHVMIPVADLNLAALDDSSYAFVTRHNEEQLESMEGVDEGFWE
ncbi:PRC-barrel domain-containing protein [Marivita sp.]|uniref:PRC-barrel domain-containing protein n=1 Tax=Marivita sp. TaxID=2003365 RepID=UPI0025B7C147|nr:PRC-barrel domain-containing protein [Marivita sp.]